MPPAWHARLEVFRGSPRAGLRGRARRRPPALDADHAAVRRNVDMKHVAVVGAGIVGLLTAYELRRRGHRVSLHSSGIAEGATHAAAGMLAPAAEIQYGQSALWPLMREAAELHDDLAADLAARTELPTGYRDHSTVVIGRDSADLATLQDLARIQRSTGATVQDLLSAQARRQEPALARALAGGILIESDRQVDPRLLSAAVVDLLGRPDSQQGPPVSIEHETITSTEQLEADHIVLAAGLGVPTIDGPHRRLDLALRPVRGDILRVRAPRSLLAPGEEGLLSRTVRAIVRGRSLYLVPRAGGQLVIGATSREDDLPGPSTAGVLQLLQDAAEILPSVRETELLEVVARDRRGTPELIDDPAVAAQPDLAPVRPDRFTPDLSTPAFAHRRTAGGSPARTSATRQGEAARQGDAARVADPARQGEGGGARR